MNSWRDAILNEVNPIFNLPPRLWKGRCSRVGDRASQPRDFMLIPPAGMPLIAPRKLLSGMRGSLMRRFAPDRGISENC